MRRFLPLLLLAPFVTAFGPLSTIQQLQDQQAAMKETVAAANAKGQAGVSFQCEAFLRTPQSICAMPFDTMAASPEELAVTRAQAKEYRDAAAPACQTESDKAALAAVDTCISDLDARIAGDAAAADARRKAAKPLVAEVRADARWAPALAKYQSTRAERERVCAAAADAKKKGSVLHPELQRECAAAERPFRESGAAIEAIATAHGVDRRDGHALGLW